MATAPDFTNSLSHLTDRDRLMLIDAIADTFRDEALTDELAEGLAAAFERAEVGTGGVFVPHYPYGAVRPGTWAEWRTARNQLLASKGLTL